MKRKLKTTNGSVIERYKRYGFGKHIGGFLYIHKDYINELPEPVIAVIDMCKVQLRKSGFCEEADGYNIIKVSTADKKISFIECKDFDYDDEPTIGNYITLGSETSFKCIKRNSNSIYHHKWLFVKDDYTGFDVEESFQRSKKWIALPSINYSRIGSKSYWETITARL